MSLPYPFFSIIILILVSSAVAIAAAREPSRAEILLDFKSSLRNAAALSNWNSGTAPCGNRPSERWVGIICENGDVWGIQLEGMGLMGEINLEALRKLSNLRSISLMNNNFDGKMPKLKKLKALKSIFLSNNQFSGEIDGDEFSGMTNLKKVYLANNKFSGEVPLSLALLPRLLELRLEGNQFQGHIPDFGAAPLQSFNVSNNLFEGPIPESLGKMDLTSFLGNKNLCGSPMNACPPQKKLTKVMMVITGIVLAMVISGIIFGFIVLLLSRQQTNSSSNPEQEIETPPALTNEASRRSEKAISEKKNIDQLQSGKLHYLRKVEKKCELSDLLGASAEVLGSGNFGSSYKAIIMDNENGSPVVVKRFKHMNNVGKEEFQEHMRRLGRLNHPNLLPLVAYYYRDVEKLFLYDFIDNGNLARHLHGNHGEGQPKLDWATRLKIVKGIGKGLAYLYTELPILVAPHGHLKSSNVLLTTSFLPLLSDYSLSPVINQETAPQLMVAYKSPEYIEHRRITKKTDVWSFGVLILEILTGKYPIQYLKHGKTRDTDLASWVNSVPTEEWDSQVFDKEMGGTENSKGEMVKLLKIGLSCCQGDAGKRWDMKEVVEKIDEVKERDGDDDFYSSYASDGEGEVSARTSLFELPLS